MNKQEFIDFIRNAHPDWDNQQILEYANTPYWHPNPTPQGTVLKEIDVTTISGNIPAVDRVVLQNELYGTYKSLLTNINRGAVPDVIHDIENIVASGKVSEAAIDAINTALADIVEGRPDPNWEPEVYETRCQDYGLEPLVLSDLD
jgi:hypothetical protein